MWSSRDTQGYYVWDCSSSKANPKQSQWNQPVQTGKKTDFAPYSWSSQSIYSSSSNSSSSASSTSSGCSKIFSPILSCHGQSQSRGNNEHESQFLSYSEWKKDIHQICCKYRNQCKFLLTDFNSPIYLIIFQSDLAYLV